MNQINFIPASFLAQQVRKRRIYRQAVIVAMAVLVLTMWTTAQHRLRATRQAFADELQVEVEAVRRNVSAVGKLKAQRASLLEKVLIQREIAQPIAHTTVIATLGRLLSDPLVITDLRMRTFRPKPSTTALETDESPRRTAVNRPLPRPPADEPDLIRVEITGLAPGDVEVADFVGRVDGHPLFQNVKMHSSKATVINDFVAHQFRMEMEVRLDCDYQRPTVRQTAAAGEVTRAH